MGTHIIASGRAEPWKSPRLGLSLLPCGQQGCWIKFWKRKLVDVPVFHHQSGSTCFLTCNLGSDWVLNIMHFYRLCPHLSAPVCSCHMAFSDLNELLTSCQLHMQMREAAIERWLYLELRVLPGMLWNPIILASLSLPMCLLSCLGLFHYNTYHIRKPSGNCEGA